MSAKSLRRFSGPAWLALAATLAGAALRYLGLLTLPPPAWVDEIWFALRAREILQTGQFPIFYKTFWGGVNPLLAWLTAGAQWLAFRDVSVSSRVVSATFSVLAVPLFFAALDEFWRAELPAPRRRWLAALASLALAFFFSTITLTRLGTEPGVALAAGLFCLWQQRRAARTGARLSFALAGLGVGAAQYLSPHARFIPVLMVLWGLHDLALAPAGQRRRLLGGLALAAAVAALSAAPLIAFFVREPEWFLGRARAVTAAAGSQGLLAFWLTNAGKLALAFSWAGDPSGRDNLAGRPYLDVVQSLGFYLGLGLTLWRARRSARARDLLVWLAVMLAPSLVTDDAPSFSRLIQLAPPALALTVLGWNALWTARPAWLGRAAAAGVAGLALAVSLAGNVADYFGRFAQQPDLAAWYTATPVRLAQDLIARAPAEAVFVERVLEAEDIFAFDFLF
ncbi:MAG: phospholipid carrier-dependent glycosyltransferase, partial [Anaerolineales bacterium]|nr:phospholipid carrier-dependent glycosyltransferase [Anaerolineales bacterium]